MSRQFILERTFMDSIKISWENGDGLSKEAIELIWNSCGADPQNKYVKAMIHELTEYYPELTEHFDFSEIVPLNDEIRKVCDRKMKHRQYLEKKAAATGEEVEATATISLVGPKDEVRLVMKGIPLDALTSSSEYFSTRIGETPLHFEYSIEVPSTEISFEVLHRWMKWIQKLNPPFPWTFQSRPQFPLKEEDGVLRLAQIYSMYKTRTLVTFIVFANIAP